MTWPRSRAPLQSVLLTAALGVACHGPSLGDRTSFDGPGVDPERYRPQIAGIEAVLFQDTPFDRTRRSQLADAFRLLGTAIRKNEPLSIRTKVLTLQLSAMAKTTNQIPLGGPTDQTPLRRQWATMRGSFFADAAWFRWSAADPVASPRPDSS